MQRKDKLALDMSPRRATRVTIIVPSPSPNETSASLEHIKLHYGDDFDAAEADDSTEAMLDGDMYTRKANRKKKNTAPVDMHAFRTCIILGMPWTAYAMFSTIFHDVRASYMTSMGISDTIPRFVPPLVTFFLGPILGAASDRSLSRWGRRNVFLMFAVLVLTVSGLLFGSAQVLFAEYTNVTCLLLFLLSIGVLLINIGLRARIMDEVPIEYQVHAQSAVAMWDGVGGALGLLLFRNTAVVVFASEISGRDILISFSAATAGILTLTAACIYLRPEPPQERPPFQPPLARLAREVWDRILYAPMLFRKLCLVHFVLFFAWSSFKDEIYNWWGSNVYSGCKDAGKVETSNILCAVSFIEENALQVVMGLTFLFVVPRVPNASFLKRASVVGLIVGELALVICVSVGKYWLPLTFGAFVATAFYQTVVTIFPYAVVGIMGKEIQESAHSFNNNGLYIGVLMLFSSASELTVQIYGAEKIAPLGTGNLMTLSCILFAAGIVCTTAFTIAGLEARDGIYARPHAKEKPMVLSSTGKPKLLSHQLVAHPANNTSSTHNCNDGSSHLPETLTLIPCSLSCHDAFVEGYQQPSPANHAAASLIAAQPPAALLDATTLNPRVAPPALSPSPSSASSSYSEPDEIHLNLFPPQTIDEQQEKEDDGDSVMRSPQARAAPTEQ
ncbi:hypothetical protein FI667_g6078, partial [Globisporangium splendens]